MKILLITPPLTQLNTPYAATPYLKGFLASQGHHVMQIDLGIELVNRIFSAKGLGKIFDLLGWQPSTPAWVQQIVLNRHRYIDTIDAVMRFLQGKENVLATRICNTEWLPQGPRFDNKTDTEWAFGKMGNIEMARHFATLYIEDLADVIKACIDSSFELSRYGEKLCLRLPQLDPVLKILAKQPTILEKWTLEILAGNIIDFNPQLICFTIPFPGNLLAAFQCSRYIRENYPDKVVIWGGGYVSTELRHLSDARVLNFAHYIVLDDGEPALMAIISKIKGVEVPLYNTFCLDDNKSIVFHKGAEGQKIPFVKIPAPDYSDLPLDKYVSLIEMANPMHALWSDGRWNKLILAHGCYWSKCAFCDTSLSYINCYEPLSAAQICDHMEKVMQQTHYPGFHFTDEAAPPGLLRQLSEEILRRKLIITWWTNIRFEKAFSADLCQLMARAGCIAVSGGLEVASDRLLKLIQKGVTFNQAYTTAGNFSQAGIMVHAYLMYGFPTQTEKETLEALDNVRQLFRAGAIHSAFWHRYAMTIHSPSGINPEIYGAFAGKDEKGSFANNEIFFSDNLNTDHDYLGSVLRKATYNYMHDIGLEWPVKVWLDRDKKNKVHKNRRK
jgi:hypothetical protein